MLIASLLNPSPADLRGSGVDVWIDKWMIRVGDSIIQKINEGIEASDFLIVVLSQASINSRWVKEELNSATIRNIEQEKHAFILPVLIEECSLPSLLQHRRYADFSSNPDKAFQELIEVIQPKALELTPDRAARLGAIFGASLLERSNVIANVDLFHKSEVI